MLSFPPPAGLARSRMILLVTVSAGYIVSQFLRNSLGVIAPDISRDMNLAPDQLGLLSGAFFFSFALAQLPVGLALDRYGPRLTMSALMLLALLGCVIFAFGHSFAGLLVGRLAMGLGSSVLLMGPLMLVSRWFDPSRFAMLAGLVLGFGGAGSLFATAPLAWSTLAFGWQGTFFLAAGFAGLLAVIFFTVIRDAPPGHPALKRQPETAGAMLRGLALVVRRRGIIPIFVMQLMAYSSFVAVLGLWGGPYLADVHGADLVARGNMLLIMAVAQITGLFVISRFDRVFDTRKWIVVVGAAASAAVLIVLAAVRDLPSGALPVLFVLFGFVSGYTPTLLAHGKSLFPAHIVGRGLSTLNIATMGGVFIVQYLTGQVIAGFAAVPGADGVPRIPAIAYQTCFAVLAALLCGAIAVYLFAPDCRPSAEDAAASRS